MKYITYPEDLSAVNVLTEKVNESAEKQTFYTWTRLNILADKKYFGTGMEALFQAVKIRELIQAGKPGDVIALEDADYKLLLNAITAPSEPWNPLFMQHYVSFLKAIRDASDKPLKAVEADDEEKAE